VRTDRRALTPAQMGDLLITQRGGARMLSIPNTPLCANVAAI